MSWSKVSGVTSYSVRLVSPEGAQGASHHEGAEPNTFKTMSGLQCGSRYHFQVAAYGDGVNYAETWSGWSGSAGATTHACPTPTPEPSPTPCADCPTPTPTPDPTETPEATPDPGGPTPTPVPDSGLADLPERGFQFDGTVQLAFANNVPLTMKKATQTAIDAWSDAMPYEAGEGNVDFCHRSTDTSVIPTSTICPTHSNPTNSVDDGATVTITVADGSLITPCGKKESLACIVPAETNNDNPELPGDALGDETIIIKDPAYVQKGNEHLRVIWVIDTPNPGQEGNHGTSGKHPDTKEPGIYMYLPGVLIHELGHAAGLGELRDDPDQSESVMHYGTETLDRKIEGVPASDADWLRYNQQQGENQSGRIRRRITL